MHFYVERYKSNEFIDIYRVWHEKVKKSDLKIKKPNFSIFLGFLKNLKNLGFLKWVSTALVLVLPALRKMHRARHAQILNSNLGSSDGWRRRVHWCGRVYAIDLITFNNVIKSMIYAIKLYKSMAAL